MDVVRFYKLWEDDLKRSGFTKNSTKDELATMLVHFHNMGGLDPEELDEAMKFVYDDRLFNELKSQL